MPNTIHTLEREVAILTARHTALFSAYSAGVFTYQMDKFQSEKELAELGRQIEVRLMKLHTLTGNEIYKVR